MSVIAALSRKTILSVAQNPVVNRFALKHGMKLGAARFVAGDKLETALQSVADLNQHGIMATLDHLGEFVGDAHEANAAADACLHVLEGIHRSGVQCNLSIKLTQLGLDIDPQVGRENLRRIVELAAAHGNFVRIDMEDSARTDLTLTLFREMLAAYGPERIGTVLQAYLYRTQDDLTALQALGANLRLVKGAYMEPDSVAFASKEAVDANYIKLIQQALASGRYTAVATHDERVIQATKQLVADRQIPRDRFEFQMLYGIRRERQQQLAAEGYRVRVYVPFGTDWYGYFTRRLAERPANVMFVLGNLFKS